MNHDRLRESVKRHEGYRNIPYRDHLGNWTVGTGHLIHRIDLVNMANYRTVGNLLDFLTDRAQHERWLDSDLLEAESDARRFIGDASDRLSDARRFIGDASDRLSDARRFIGDAWDRLSDARREVLTEMAFQMGERRLAGFVKFRDAVLAGQWGVAKAEMLNSLWASQTPQRANELAARMLAG